METSYRKRDPAFIVEVKELLNGEFVKTEGWNPNYIKTSFDLNVSRVALFGTVVEFDEKSITLDDSTGVIEIRSFDDLKCVSELKNKDFIFIIGKVRQFNDLIYLSPEVCKTVSSDWKKYRDFNIEKVKDLVSKGLIKNRDEDVSFNSGVDVVNEVVDNAVNETTSSDPSSLTENVLKFIETEDSGEGVEKVKIIDSFDDSSISDVVDNLIMEGDIFEVKPGVFKVLK